MVAGLAIVSFRGHAINDEVTYGANFVEDSGIFSTHTADIIETQRFDEFPVPVRSQPTGIDIPILIELKDLAQAKYDQLKQWFDPREGDGYLIATDGSSVQRRILCTPRQLIGMHQDATNLFHVMLHSSSGVWEANSATEDDDTITADEDEVEIVNAGNTRTPVTLTITATVAKSSADSYTHMRRIFIASNTTEPMDDPVGDGYPIEVSGAAFTSPGDDVRIILNSEEQNRWIDTDAIWINLRMRPRKYATLAANIDADDTIVTVSNPEGFAADVFPDRFLAFIEDEVLDFTKTGAFSATAVRGFHSTAASHSAGATLKWIEHRYLYAIYDFDTPDDPPASTDRQPLIDLGDSTNLEHVWHGPFFNDSDRRSRAWQRQRTDDGENTTHTRIYDDSGTMVMESKSPSAGKPAFNNAIMDFPVRVASGSDTVVLDQTVDETMVAQGYVLDADGNQSLLYGLFTDDNLLNATPGTAGSYSPGDPLARIRLNGRLGVVSGDIGLDDVEDEGTGAAISVFVLEAEIIINAVLVGHFDGVASDTITIKFTTTDGSGDPGPAIYGPFDITVANTGPALEFYELPTPLTIGPGSYFFYFISTDCNALQHTTRTNPNQYNGPTKSPVLGIISLTAEPQSDANLESEATVVTDDIEITLEGPTLSGPQVFVAAEEDMYLLDAELAFDEIDRSIGVFFPMPATGEITINTETREAIDTETDTPIPFALTVPEWPYLQPSTNTIVWNEVGATGLTLAWSYRGKYL